MIADLHQKSLTRLEASIQTRPPSTISQILDKDDQMPRLQRQRGNQGYLLQVRRLRQGLQTMLPGPQL
ncbi:hypothetical protein CDV31_013228 [Fusarium ambrosium]|uniref:Uncharacterized protein n=1 Tax=Fusarium ambrosium TaxID=131363 RepID=A0A428T4L9_9HYPO|nr:hypothetical protein CDV31_013228 [Fusarium ambrosium]